MSGPRRLPKRERPNCCMRVGLGMKRRSLRVRTPGIETETGTVQDMERVCLCIFSWTAEEYVGRPLVKRAFSG